MKTHVLLTTILNNNLHFNDIFHIFHDNNVVLANGTLPQKMQTNVFLYFTFNLRDHS